MNPNRRQPRESYSLPLPPVLILGTILAATFYGLIVTGPLDFQLLRRYCLSHPVAIASVSLFFVGIVGLLLKWQQATRQFGATHRAGSALRRLVTDGEDVPSGQRAQWLAASWQAQTSSIKGSWLGTRIYRAVELQIRRGRRNQLESDLKWLSENDADRQHESYSLLRIINWAMPMLGFLGTVLGISKTLGQLDTQMLATQQQEAMNQLTAGLYVAFDTTAIALILTVFSMFVQFGVNRIETKLLSRIDTDAGDNLIGFLAVDQNDAEESLLNPIRDMTAELLRTVHTIVETQASVWTKSIEESQRQWEQWNTKVAQSAESEIRSGLAEALQAHVKDLTKLQDDGNRQVESRLQQWQTTLSDHARHMQGQQKELSLQTQALHDLVKSTADLQALEETIHEGVDRLENVGRIETAATCIAEAVAMLGTSLERAGAFRGTPIRPRSKKSAAAEDETLSVAVDTRVDSDTSSQRKAA